MTNPMFSPQPNYSGVTIQIANPSVYAGANPEGINCPQRPFVNDGGCYVANPYIYKAGELPNNFSNPNNEIAGRNDNVPKVLSYPPQYYLNNYNNYMNNPAKDLAAIPAENTRNLQDAEKFNSISEKQNESPIAGNSIEENQEKPPVVANSVDDGLEKNPASDNIVGESAGKSPVGAYSDYASKPKQKEDMTKSSDIIEDLDRRVADAEEEKKNKAQQDIVPLTDEYIKSLENYLDNPNDEIRLMASKEVLTRLDEDKDRYDDAALNALLNKMLQDPSKLIRIAALSAFASQLASGNDYTVNLLHNIQQNPNADKEDILQAADILLKMSAGKEVKDIPNPSGYEQNKG